MPEVDKPKLFPVLLAEGSTILQAEAYDDAGDVCVALHWLIARAEGWRTPERVLRVASAQAQRPTAGPVVIHLKAPTTGRALALLESGSVDGLAVQVAPGVRFPLA